MLVRGMILKGVRIVPAFRQYLRERTPVNLDFTGVLMKSETTFGDPAGILTNEL